MPFYMQYLATWPEYFTVAEAPNGNVMAYGMFPIPLADARSTITLLLHIIFAFLIYLQGSIWQGRGARRELARARDGRHRGTRIPPPRTSAAIDAIARGHFRALVRLQSLAPLVSFYTLIRALAFFNPRFPARDSSLQPPRLLCRPLCEKVKRCRRLHVHQIRIFHLS
jgi:hypothetical protein